MKGKALYSIALCSWGLVVSLIHAQSKEQQKQIDSLIYIIQNPENVPDTTLVKTNADLGSLTLKSNPLESQLYWENVIEMTLNKTSENKDLSEFYKLYLAKAYNGLGVISRRKSNFPDALAYYYKALTIREELGDTSGMGTSYFNLGVIYNNRKEYDKALDYFFKSLIVRKELNDTGGISNCYGEIGKVFRKREDYDSALVYYNYGLNFSYKSGDQEKVAIFTSNIGVLYTQLHKLDSAEIYFNEALEIQLELNSKPGIMKAFINLGNLSARKGEYVEALIYYEHSLELALKLESLSAISKLYFSISRTYEKQKKYKLALESFKLHKRYLDSLILVQNNEEFARKETQFDFEKRMLADSLEHAQEQALATSKIRQQQIGLFSAIGILLLMIGLAIVIYKSKKRSDELLLNILPYETAQELKKKGYAEAKRFDQVTVLFTDFKGFTMISERLSPEKLVQEIDECFKAFDKIMTKYGIEKIKTIGDSYMAACGLPVPNKTNAIDTVKAALEIRDFMNKQEAVKRSEGKPFFQVRIGVHTGPVVAGIVGIKKFAYDIWGDTVNTASRMESSGEPGRVNISGTTYELIKKEFQCTYRGKISAKNKGEIDMYYVNT